MNLVQLFFLILIISPIGLGLFNQYQNKGLEAPEKTGFYYGLINSAILYALAFNLIFFFQELFLVLGKKYLGLTAYLYHNNHTWDGTHPMASLMQGSGALAIFIIGLICLIWFQLIRKSASFWKVLVLWLAFQGLLQSIPQVMVAFFDKNTDVGQALAGYLNLDFPILPILAIASIWAIALVSIWFCRPLLETAPAEIDFDNSKVRLRYIRFIAAGAALLGCFLIIPFRILPMIQVIAPFIVSVFSIPWTWTVASRIKNIDRIYNNINEKIHWQPIALLIILLLIFRFILAPGITF